MMIRNTHAVRNRKVTTVRGKQTLPSIGIHNISICTTWVYNAIHVPMETAKVKGGSLWVQTLRPHTVHTTPLTQ